MANGSRTLSKSVATVSRCLDRTNVHRIRSSAALFIALTMLTAGTIHTLTGWLTRHVYLRSSVNKSCRAFMKDGYIEENKWRPRSCRMHYYSKNEFEQCMMRSERARKRRNRFVFIGDSRMREQHQEFVDLVARKPHNNTSKYSCYQYSITFSDDLFDAEFGWNIYLQSFPRLQLWLKNPPAFVVISVGLWHLMGSRSNLTNGLNAFKGALKAKLHVLNLLSNVTTVIWMPQAPLISNHNCALMPHFVRTNNKTDCAQNWKTSAWARAYNDAVYEILRNGSSSTIMWTAAKDISQHFALDIFDGLHFVHNCQPPASPALSLRSQMLINLHCNRFMDPEQRTELCCDKADTR